jgi:hypothetical protein
LILSKYHGLHLGRHWNLIDCCNWLHSFEWVWSFTIDSILIYFHCIVFWFDESINWF